MANGASAGDGCLFFSLQARRLDCLIPSYLWLDPLEYLDCNDFDLILLDVMMPGLDGREVCRRITSDPALAGVPVILHSSADEADVDWRAVGAGAFLQKPFPMHRLADVVRRILRGPHGME